MLILPLLLAPLFAILTAIWTVLDAARRKQNWFAWGVAVSVTGVAFFAWLAVRRRFEVKVERHSPAFSLALVTGLLFMVGLTFLLMLNVRTFLFQVARVEGHSMSPTLNDLDRLIVNRAAYRFSDPQIGDIVMMHYPLKPERQFVERVAAEEGDQIRIVDGQLFRNDLAIDEPYVKQENRSRDRFGPVVVPQGYYFVLGDRRNNSSDSRHWGFVPKKYVIGKVVYRWWPPAASGTPR